MAIVRYPIKLNVKPSPYPLIKSIALVQGDTANVFAIELQEDKQPFNIEDCYVTATFKKADDNVVILKGEIIDATNGLVEQSRQLKRDYDKLEAKEAELQSLLDENGGVEFEGIED